MLHPNHEVVSTTRKQDRRMFKLFALAIPLCLALSLSIGLPAFAQARQATVSPNATTSKVINGSFTVWTDNALFAGPASQTVAINLSIDSASGAVTYTFSPFMVTDPASGNTVTVSSAPGTSNTGQFDAATGQLVLNGTLQLQNVPIVGTVTTKASSLSTETTITASDGTTHSGQRLNANNQVELDGTTSFTSLGITANIQIDLVGTLQ